MPDFRFSIVVPCHNEASVIRRKIANTQALASGRSAELLIVDDYSTDGTVAQAQEALTALGDCGFTDRVRIHLNGRHPGKNDALRTAFDAARGEILLVTDADILLDADVLDRVWPRFAGDPSLGCLCLTPRIRSADPAMEHEYVAYYESFNRRLKMLQSRIDSVPILHGQAMFIRAALNLVPHDDLPADDVDFALQTRVAGARVRYAADTPFYEEIAPDGGRVFDQKLRRAKAVMRSLWRYRRLLLNPRYGAFGLLCYPIDFMMYFVAAPMVITGALAAAAWAVATYGTTGAALVGLAVVALWLPPLERLSRYVTILIVSQLAILIEATPRIRWTTNRQ